MKLAIALLDALDPDYIFSDLGNFPKLKEMMKGGVYGSLASTYPAMTRIAVASFFVGYQIPSRATGQTKKILPNQDLIKHSFLTVLDKNNVKAGTFMFRRGWVNSKSDGFAILGARSLSYPVGVRKHFEQEDLLESILKTTLKSEEIVKQNRERIIKESSVLKEYPVDIFLSYYRQLDFASHILIEKGQSNELQAIYSSTVDKLIKDFTSVIRADNYLIFGDHGAYKAIKDQKDSYDMHKPNSFYIFWGDDIQGWGQKRASIMDLTPTILKMFGVTKPAYMTGREIF